METRAEVRMEVPVLRWWRSVPVPARRGAQVVVALTIAGTLLWPQVSEAERALDALADLDVRLLALAAVLQAASIVAQALLTREVLPAGSRPTIARTARIELASTAAGHTIPAGSLGGSAVGLRLLARSGVDPAEAGFAVGVRGLGSALVLNLLLWLGLLVSIPLEGFAPVYSVAALGGLLLLAAIGAVAALLLRYGTGTTERVQAVAARLPLVEEDAVPRAIRTLAERLRDLRRHPSVAAVAAVWSAGYWLLAAAALWLLIAAFGHQTRPDQLLVAYGVGNVVAFVPVTPRGLGTLEATMIPILRGFGVPGGTAALGVLGWRLLQFWAPIPLGAAAYVSLRHAEGPADPGAPRRARETGPDSEGPGPARREPARR